MQYNFWTFLWFKIFKYFIFYVNFLNIHFSATPCKLTPGKVHRILAPETPNLKGGSRRKSDGKLCITESPDLDSIKQTKMTPRRMAASLALNKKRGFYSGRQSFKWIFLNRFLTLFFCARNIIFEMFFIHIPLAAI